MKISDRPEFKSKKPPLTFRKRNCFKCREGDEK